MWWRKWVIEKIRVDNGNERKRGRGVDKQRQSSIRLLKKNFFSKSEKNHVSFGRQTHFKEG